MSNKGLLSLTLVNSIMHLIEVKLKKISDEVLI